MLNYFRRLKFTTKVLVLSFVTALFLFTITLLINIFLYGILKQDGANSQQLQLFSTIDLLFMVSLAIFGISGFRFLLTEMVNFPYNEHKMEVATTIFLVLFLLINIPATLTVDQFPLSYSLKTVLDVIFFLIGSVYIVLATAVYYLSETSYLVRRYTRWSVFVFISFFGMLVLETMRSRVDLLTLYTFVGVYLVGILLIIMKDVQILFRKPTTDRENKKEIVVFILLVLLIIGFRSFTIFSS